LVFSPISAAPAQRATVAPPLSITDNVIGLPDQEIGPRSKVVFAVPIAQEALNSDILLRFEAMTVYGKEAGYAHVARIAVNGVVLDESHFPVNWGQERTFSLPKIRRQGLRLYQPGPKTWTVRYDCDRSPPVASGMYYSPEMAANYVYMFPIGGLLNVGENRIEIENTSAPCTLRLFACERDANASIGNVRCRRVTDTSVEVAWDSDLPRHEIDYRVAGAAKWQTVRYVLAWENPYNVIMLVPGTEYELRVRGLPTPMADIKGKVAMSGPVQSDVLKVRTAGEPEIRSFAGLRLHPTRPLPGQLRTYPCIESHNGFLWVTDASLRLLKLNAQGRKVLWKSSKPMATWPLPPPSGYMGIPDTTVFAGKLWVTYNVQATRNPKGYVITQSRQYLLSYDLATARVSEPVGVEPTKPTLGSWEGGVEAWRGKLWVMHMDVWLEGRVRRTHIVLRTYGNGQFGKPIIYDNCPTVYPYGPSMSVFNDRLVILFSDLAAAELDKDHEPLLYTTFDGTAFREAKLIQNTGRSRYAKGVQIGDRFICAYKCSAPYYRTFGYEYHDIALSLFTPGTNDAVRTMMYVNDRKYNSSPDVARHGDDILLVHNKHEHRYGRPDNPAIHHGVWNGRITRAMEAVK